jgi:hypothetical protein
MIDPFPNVVPFGADYEPSDSVLSIAQQMFSSLRSQVSFKIDELLLARDNDTYSRYMIAPSRSDRTGSQKPLACGSLQAFGGFLHKAFRAHDFQLGRRNCQKFLLDRFVLPSQNELFGDWEPQKREHYALRKEDGKEYLPIIPLADALRPDVGKHAWPTISESKLQELKPLLQNRVRWLLERLLGKKILLDALAKALSDKKAIKWLVGLFVRLFWKRIRNWASAMATGKVMEVVRTNLDQEELLSEDAAQA